MSLMGQSLHFGDLAVPSGLPPYEQTLSEYLGMSQRCHERTHGVQQSTSFNDVVGEQQHRLRDGQPERLGGLEVDHQLEARRLFDWEIARIGARHNFGNVPCGAPILFAKVCPIRDETSHIGKFSKSEYCRKPVLQREFRKLLFIKDHERVGEYKDALPMVAIHCGKSFINPVR